MKIERLDQIRENSRLLSFSDGTVVRELVDEIESLRKELDQRDKALDNVMAIAASEIEEGRRVDHPLDKGVEKCQAALEGMEIILDLNNKIHAAIRKAPTDV